jgi:hypothetical protein
MVRVWAADLAASFEGPTQIRVVANGVVCILSNNAFYLHDKDGNLLDIIPVKKFGMEQFIGDFWMYENADILMRRPLSQKLTIAGEAEMFARTGAGEKDRLGNGESILQRCSTKTFVCSTFGRGREVFDKITPFHVYADEKNGLTYVADTIGHQLLLLDDHGNILKKSNTPFQFPNEIELESNGLLYVADTNNHRIVGVKTGSNQFGEIEKQFRIVHPANALKLTWPVELIHTPDNKWWVINADDDMRDGTIMIYRENGEFEKTVPLPSSADPLRLAVVGSRILVSDTSLMRVYSISLQGQMLDDFGSPSFKLDLSELRRQKVFYDNIARLSVWALLALLIASFILARQARIYQAGLSAMQPDQHQPKREGLVNRRYDYHSLIGFHRIKFVVITVLLIVASLFLVLISRGLTYFPKEFVPIILLTHFILSFNTFMQLKHSYVEITEQGITFRGWRRDIYSPWFGVKKVSVYGKNCKIHTDNGNFTIGLVEPAGSSPRGVLDFLKPERNKFLKELVEEIQKRAPMVKLSISLFARWQWRRM